MLSIILVFTIIIFIVYQIVEDTKIKERHKHKYENNNLITLSTNIIQSIARYEMLKHVLCSEEHILIFEDEIEEINKKIDNAVMNVVKYKTDLTHALYTFTTCPNISNRLSRVIDSIDDHLNVLNSKKNESFDDAITDDLICIINDIQKSM